MPRGVTKRRPVTIAALLDAAFELFADQGYGATSIGDICTRAGLTKGAFYSNFESKDALFLALFDQRWAARIERLRQALPTGDAVVAALEHRTLFGSEDPELDRRWLLISTEFSLHAIRNPHVAELLVDHEAQGRAALGQLIASALESACRVPRVPITDLTKMIIAVTEGTQIQALTEQAAHRAPTRLVDHQAIATLLEHLTTQAESAAAGQATRSRPGHAPIRPMGK